MTIDKKKTFLINILFFGVIATLCFVGFKYIVPVLTPFIIAFVIAWLIQRPVKQLSKHYNLNKKVTGIALLLLLYLTIGALAIMMSLGLFSFLNNLFTQLPSIINNDIKPFLDGVTLEISKAILALPDSIKDGLLTALNSLDAAINDLIALLSTTALNIATSLVKNVPSFFVLLVTCIIASFFFVGDYDGIVQSFYRHLNPELKAFLNDLYGFVKNKLVVIGKSYITIMTLTFVELAIGFFVIGLDGALWVALGIAIFDILPVFGTGGIMIPWALLMFINQNVTRGIQIIVIYIIVTIIRNIIEPKIVGSNLGLHPLITLASMLIGVRFFGFIGMFACPLFISFLFYLHKEKQSQNNLVLTE